MAHVAAGTNHTICATADGSVLTWGLVELGKLGLGDQFNKLVLTLVRGKLQNKAVVQVAAGDELSMCVAEDGSVYSWGSNDYRQLGVAGVDDAVLPVAVQTLDINAM